MTESELVGAFSDAELVRLPEPVRRHFVAAIAPGTPIARSARLRMRGTIKLGRWLPFHATQWLDPRRGTIWNARIAGVITGSDRFLDGEGAMDWRLAGLIRLVHAEGADVSRSTAERVAGESMWVPTALLPRFGVEWGADDDHTITARFAVDQHRVSVTYALADDDRIESLVFERWGDPSTRGDFGLHRFGGVVTEHRTFGGLTIPSAGSVGWFYGTDRWRKGEFFRYRVTGYEASAQ